ncbi:hypothetical protein TCSYLVIO_003449 [Trypanosoma cruzi]|nr:hypothetical protein TCSYLVIO_003449 [Trypanosoma cruzi]
MILDVTVLEKGRVGRVCGAGWGEEKMIYMLCACYFFDVLFFLFSVGLLDFFLLTVPALWPDPELVLMAKDTAKKNMRRNEERMRRFTICTLAVNVLSLVFIIYHRGSLPWFRDVVGVGFWAAQEFVALFLLKAFAKPTCSSTGELLECPDASNPSELGMYSYAQDLLWVCWVVELLCYLFHWAFFLLYLPIPAMALYQFWAFIGPLLLRRQPSADESSEGAAIPRNRAERRRQELLQRKKNTK